MPDLAEQGPCLATDGGAGSGARRLLHRIALGDVGLLLLSLYRGGLVALFGDRGDIFQAPFPRIGPSVARVFNETGMTTWLPLCALVCWRAVVRWSGWTRGSRLAALLAILGSVVAILYAELPR